jgi:signal transduction histidine kinase
VQVPERVERRHLATLPPLAAEAAEAVLSPPRLPAGAAAQVPLAIAAARTTLPVTIVAPAGAGRLAMARALHARAGRTGPLVAATGRRPCLDGLPEGASLTLDVTALAPETLLVLEALLDDGRVWVLAHAEPGRDLPPALAPRLGAAMLVVPPLARRTAELPALADAMLAAHATRLGRTDVAFTPAARARLGGHAWAGDLAELETVVARAVLAAPEHLIDEEHLGLNALDVNGTAAGGEPDVELELLLAELAHELRNPLVTIKTYADHLPDMLEDAELRTRFATLTGEAIERMDGVLENLLAFARLRAPRRRPVELEPIIDRVLGEIAPELAERAISIRRAGDGGVRCAVDADHLAYAFRNLFAGVAREAPPRDELSLETAANGVVTIRFAAGTAAGRLRQLVAPNGAGALGDPTLLPLSFRLARGVLERNGGGLTLEERPDEGTMLVVQLPATQEERK